MEVIAYIESAAIQEDNSSCARLQQYTETDHQLAIANYRPLSTVVLFLLLTLTPLASFTKIATALQMGDQGRAVTALQEGMEAAGVYDGPVTGYYGELTQEAVTKFQTDQGLTSDGIAGVKTMNALQKISKNQGQQAIALNKSSENLQRGSNGHEVTQLQHSLRALGFYDGPVTGYFGSLTEKSVIKFQQAMGLAVDGIVGSQTKGALAAE